MTWNKLTIETTPAAEDMLSYEPVSYTHLDVYKRQILDIGAGLHILALGLAHLLILKELVFQMRETWNIIKKSRMFLL